MSYYGITANIQEKGKEKVSATNRQVILAILLKFYVQVNTSSLR